MLVTEENGQPKYQWWLNGNARAADATHAPGSATRSQR
jgi:hypothetical protein